MTQLDNGVIEGLALSNVIASWKHIVAGFEERIAGLRTLQKHTTDDVSINIQAIEAEISIYRTAIEQHEARLKALQS